MILMVVDGQGGGIGATIIKRLRETLDYEQEIFALGTNSIATSRMMKAGANRGATGENASNRSNSFRCGYHHWSSGDHYGQCDDGRTHTQDGRSHQFLQGQEDPDPPHTGKYNYYRY